MAILQIASGILKVLSVVSEISSEDLAEKRNERIFKINAELRAKNQKAEESQLLREQHRFLGSQEVARGASGIRLSGSALDIMAETERLQAEDTLALQEGGRIESLGARLGRDLQKARSKDRRTSLAIGGVQQLVGTGSSLLAKKR